MKAFRNLLSVAIALWIVGFFMSCEQKVTVGSVVHPDGAIDRTIAFKEVDSSKVVRNMFGVRESDGWDTKFERATPDDSVTVKRTDQKYSIVFSQKFVSAAEANKVLDKSNDSLFRIRSSFEKKFRWFYTYIDYSDTYVAINRFRHLPKEDFFTPEDFAFINRLPAEGRSITKADSIYLDNLTEKVYGHYALRACYEEHFHMMLEAVNENSIGRQWTDSLNRYKGLMFSNFSKNADDKDSDIMEKAFMIQLIDTLGISFPIDRVSTAYRRKFAEMTPRFEFMMEAASEGKFTNMVKMPWDVIETNADSIDGPTLYWNPPTLKLALTDYTMYATARKLNYWAVIVSAIVILLAVFAFVRKKKF
jgi:hypothetical protein